MKNFKGRRLDPEVENAFAWDAESNVGGSTVDGSTVGGSAVDRPAIIEPGAGVTAPGPLISYVSAQTSTTPASRVPPGYATQARNQGRRQTAGMPRSTSGGLGASTSGNAFRSRASNRTGARGGWNGNASNAGNPRTTSGTFDPTAYGKPNVGLPRSTSGRLGADGYGNTSNARMPRKTSGTAAHASHTSPGKVISRSASNPHDIGRQSRNGTGFGGDPSSSVGVIADRYAGRGAGRSVANSRAFTVRSGATSSYQKWPKNTDLVTARKAMHLEAAALTEQDNEQFKRAPAEDEHFPYMGFYIWPYRKSGPESLLGWRLELLNPLRVSYRVFIETHTASNCLCVSSRESGENIQPVLDGIRLAVQHANAKKMMRHPVFFVVPPTPAAMKTIVRPRESRPAPNKFAKFLELAGDEFSREEQEDWKDKRAAMVADGRARFEEHLIGNMMKIEPLKGWMRMRVHLGSVELTAYFRGFAASKVSFDKFVKMVTYPRQSGDFDKKMQDPLIAMRLRDKILERPDIFMPVYGRTDSLHEVEFKNTETIMVTTSGGEKLRLKAEIDKNWEDNVSTYQTGAIHLFRFNEKNLDNSKLLAMTTIDIERGIDCHLEVIADDEITTIPARLHGMIRASVTTKSRICVDKLGLEYPQVSPHPTSELRITSVVVKSVVQYKIEDSGHVVEIAIYRTWSGAATKAVPLVEASVSIFHPDWDEWMESIENTTRSRKFGDRLCNLFHDGTPGQGCMDTFFEKMMMVQGLLADAKDREFETRQAALAAGEVGGELV